MRMTLRRGRHAVVAVSAVTLLSSTVTVASLSAAQAQGASAAARPDFSMPFPCQDKRYGSTYVNGHGYKGGQAIDFNGSRSDGSGDYGDPVVASASGTVAYILANNGHVDISHGGGWSSDYAHMVNIKVRVGDKVTKGQVIGQVGGTGAGGASNSHLHYEQRLNEVSQRVHFDGTAAPTYVSNGTVYGQHVVYTSKNCASTPTPKPDNLFDSKLQPVTGDWDGDGRTDFGLRRVSTGKWYLMTREPGGLKQQSYAWTSGAGSDLQPVTGDWNKDGKTDIGLRRVSTGKWYLATRDGKSLKQTSHEWKTGAGRDLQPVTGDWNADGRSDIGLRRISTGKWYTAARVSGGLVRKDHNWESGRGTDLQPVTGDWNADGRSDIGLRRASTGKWYTLTRPTGGGLEHKSYNWESGRGTDLQPVTGDWNADGRSDIGLRRISSGTWYTLTRPTGGGLEHKSYPWANGGG